MRSRPTMAVAFRLESWQFSPPFPANALRKANVLQLPVRWHSPEQSSRSRARYVLSREER